MNEGDIALAPLPQADGQIKNRPWFCSGVCRRLAISSSAASAPNSTSAWRALTKRSRRTTRNLPPADSRRRRSSGLGFLAVLPDSALLGKIGSLSSKRRLRLLANLCRHLSSQEQSGARK